MWICDDDFTACRPTTSVCHSPRCNLPSTVSFVLFTFFPFLFPTNSALPSLPFQQNARYQLHICGEGGEYETFTVDCPLFTRRIVLFVLLSVPLSPSADPPRSHLQ
jgi:hypothetical protein